MIYIFLKANILFFIINLNFLYAKQINLEQFLNKQDYIILDIDINIDGIKDKVVSKIHFGNELYFFKHLDNQYKLIFSGINFYEDGGNKLKSITPLYGDNRVLRITTYFPDRGYFFIHYDISFLEKKWILSEVSYDLIDWQKYPNKITTCNKQFNIDLETLNDENWYEKIRPFSEEWSEQNLTCKSIDKAF